MTGKLTIALYSVITLLACLAAWFWPATWFPAIAQNLVAGVIVILFVQAIVDNAQGRSRRPAELAALDANLKVLGMANRVVFDGLGAAAVNGVVDLNYMETLSHDRQETRVAAVLERVELRSLTFAAPDQALRFLLIGDGQELAAAVDYALVAHGAYQDPQTIDLLSKLRRSAFLWSCENEPRIGLWPAHREEAAWSELITLINALDSDLRQRCKALGRVVPKAPLEGQFLALTQESLYSETMRRKASAFRATQPLAAAPKP